MERIDPINTREGVACAVCGDGPAVPELIGGKALPICDHCYELHVETCDGDICGHAKWLFVDMERVHSGVFCRADASAQSGVEEGRWRELLADERNGK